MHCNMTCDEKLTAALLLYQEKWMNSLPEDRELENIKFSKNFRSRMEAAIKCADKCEEKKRVVYFTTVFRRIASLLVASVVFISLALFSVTALRESFLSFFKSSDDGISTTINLSEDPAYDSSAVFEETYFSVPNSFKKTEYNYSSDYFRKKYVNDDGNYIEIYQGVVHGGGVLTLDTEESKVTQVDLFGSNALYYEKRGNRLFWQYGASYYIMVSDLPMEEMLQIARSANN